MSTPEPPDWATPPAPDSNPYAYSALIDQWAAGIAAQHQPPPHSTVYARRPSTELRSVDAAFLPRRFALDRYNDPSGVSGVGRIAVGVQWWDGRVELRWLGTTTGVSQSCQFESVTDVLRIHGHGHRTAVTWIDPETTPTHPNQEAQP